MDLFTTSMDKEGEKSMLNFDLESYIKDLSPELQEKARACTSVQELLKLADENSIELSPDQLEKVSGGTAFTAGTPKFNYHITNPTSCFYCKIEGRFTGEVRERDSCGVNADTERKYHCDKCGDEWWAVIYH